MGKSYCPGWSQTVAEGNFWAKTPAYLCGNQPVSQAILRIIRGSLSRRRGPLRGPNSDTISERYTRPTGASSTSREPRETPN